MAGVRHYDESHMLPISLPKGMPEDASTLTQFICNDWDTDGHNHSWLNHAEIQELEQWLRDNGIIDPEEKYWGYFFGNSWGGFEPGDHGVEDVRFVFWFDS
jgi:hypothetical protein